MRLGITDKYHDNHRLSHIEPLNYIFSLKTDSLPDLEFDLPPSPALNRIALQQYARHRVCISICYCQGSLYFHHPRM